MALVLLLMLQGRTSGGHGLLEAVPRIYQVTPDIPDRRRATQQDGSQTTDLADSLKESQLAARSGPSPPRRTSPTTRITTASRSAAARILSPILTTWIAVADICLDLADEARELADQIGLSKP